MKRTARYRPRLESLEDRRLLVAAVDLASISGLVFDDFSGNGFDAGEQISGAALDLYRDNGDGQFNRNSDNVLRMTMSGTDGRYRFNRLPQGQYFVVQQANAMLGLQEAISPVITIDSDDVKGQITTVIDSFDVTTQSVSDSSNDSNPDTSVASGLNNSEVIGGERDLFANLTSQNGAVELSINNTLLPGQLIFDSPATGQGVRRITWDGTDGDATSVNDTGLANVDLTANAEGIQLQIRGDLGGNAVLRIYSDDGNAGTANRFSSATIPIPQTVGTFLSAEFIPFTDLNPAPGGGADFSNVTAIELEITGIADLNGAAELVGAVGTTELTQNFDNFETADLGLTKTVDVGQPNVNQEVTFTITLSNAGPDNATGVTVLDVLPAGISFVRSNTAAGNYDSGNGQWMIGSIVSGSSATLTLTGTVDTVGAKTNNASITNSDQIDSNVSNNQDSATVTPQTINLSLEKLASDRNPNLNDNVTFRITVLNSGVDEATNVSVRDQLPSGLSFVSAIPTRGSYNTTSGIWTIPNVGVGERLTLPIVATVTQTGTFTNTAEVIAADQFDTNSTPGNADAGEDDIASDTIRTPIANLSLSKSINDPNPDVGDSVTYTVNVTNAGPDPATSVRVTDLLPAGLTAGGSNVDIGTYTANNGLWEIGNLAVNQTATLRLFTTVNSAASITNRAEITAADQADSNSTPGNNVETEDDQASVTIDPVSADLGLTKSVNQAQPNLGEEVTFTVRVTNAGPDGATGISIRDLLPTGTTFVSAGQSSGNYDPGTGVWMIDSLGVNASATLTLRATAGTTNLVTNTAQILAADQQDPNTANNAASAEIQGKQINLSLTKTINDSRPNVGDEVTFTVTVRNDGTSTATGVQVTDTLPDGVTLTASLPSEGSFNTTSRVWTVGTLNVGQQETLQLTTRIDRALTTATNVAQVTAANEPDVNSTPGNGVESEDDQQSVSFSTPVADLVLTKNVNNEEPNVGDSIAFNVRLTNNGPDAATNIVVTDVIPTGLNFDSTSLSVGQYNSTSGNWTIPELAVGATATLDINSTVLTRGQKTNTARVVSVDQFDPTSTPGNNVETEDDQDSASVTPPEIDLSLQKTVSPTRPAVGQRVTFVITASNAGPSNATGVLVTDTLPAGLLFVDSQTAAGDSFDSRTGVWNIGDLSAGSSTTLEIIAVIDSPQPLTNVAEVTAANQFDRDSTVGNGDTGEDDYASVVVTPASADLSLEKRSNTLTPNVGDEVTFTLTAANAGPDSAADVVIRDLLPAGLDFVSSNPSVGSYDAGSGIWNVPQLNSGSTATLDIRATVTSTGDKTNSAEIIGSSQFDIDSVPGNDDAGEDDQDAVTLSPQLVDLALTKSIDNDRPNVGDSIAYTLTLSNDGPSTATGVAVTDQLPANVLFETAVASQGSYNSQTGIWTVGSVVSGALPTLRINATIGNTRTETNTAEVTSVDQPDIDSTPANNATSEDDFASQSLTTQEANLSLQKSVDNSTPNQDQNVNFLLTLTNAGPDNATAVSVRESLPPGLAFVSSDPSTGNYDAVNGVWSLANVPAGTTATLLLEARVDTPTALTNTAEITAARQFDPNSTPGNAAAGEDDIASATVTPPVVDISVRASTDNATPLEGDVIRLTLTAQNAGPAAASGVAVNTIIPAGLTLISAQPQNGTYDATTGQWEIGSLAVGASSDLVVTARVDTRGLKQIPIEVVGTDQFDIDSTPANDIDAEDDQTELIIRAPRLLSKRLFLSR